MHDRVRLRLGQRARDFFAPSKVAADEGRTLVYREAMAFGQVIEDEDFVPFIEQQLRRRCSRYSPLRQRRKFSSAEGAAGVAAVKKETR